MSYAKRRKFLWMLLRTGIALVAAMAASGTTLVALRFEELTERASAVARVRCVSARSFMESGEIWTETQFAVEKTEKGLLGLLLTVRMPGGYVEGLRSHVDSVPGFRPGEELYLFLLESKDGTYRVLGWTQGTFRIRRDAKSGAESVTQDSSETTLFDPTTRTFRKEGVREMSVSKFEERLTTTLARRPE